MNKEQLLNYWTANENIVKATVYNAIVAHANSSSIITLDDTMQDVFMSLYEKVESLNINETNFFAYVRYQAKNEIKREVYRISKFYAHAPKEQRGYEHTQSLRHIPCFSDYQTLKLDIKQTLTKREYTIYKQVVAGYTQTEISNIINLSVAQIKREWANIKNKIAKLA